MPQIYRTVFTVEVFSQGPFELDDTPEEYSDLASIDYAIMEGDCIGNVEQTSQEVVPPEQVKTELLRIGNDGTYFDEVD